MADPRPDREQTRREPGGRVPPHNLQAEESLLGAMLLTKDAIAAAVEVVGADDFYKPAHGHVFEAITSLDAAGEPVDAVTVAEALRRAGLLDAIGGPGVLVSLQSSTPATTSAGRYARIVEEHALLRRLIRVSGEVAEKAFNLPEDVTKVIDEAESMVFAVAQRRVTDTTSELSQLLDATLDRLEELYSREVSLTGVPTGYTELDTLLSGLQPSALVVVGARPSMGKCVAAGTLVLDPVTGTRRPIEELHAAAAAGQPVQVLALDEQSGLLTPAPVAATIDDGFKPVFRVRTRLGRVIETTATHPFLTFDGWVPLGELTTGTRVAVPRALAVFGDDALPEHEVKLLGYLLGDGGLTGTSPLFTTASEQLLAEVRDACAELGVRVTEAGTSGNATTYRLVTDRGKPNPLLDRLRAHGLMGRSSHTKFVPDAVFRLPRSQLAVFLSRLLATDGSAWWTDAGTGYGRISYCTVSHRLALDVQHLLLRFGLNARVRVKQVKYAGGRRTAYELELMSAEDIVAFADQIGIFGKEAAVARLRARAAARRRGSTRDTRPIEVWTEILTAKGQRSWADISERAGRPRHHNWHVERRAPRRSTVAEMALVLDDLPLWCRANSDIYWDEIIEITPLGLRQVYDLTVDEHHNFVADDVIVHNTAFALGIGTNVALQAQRPVLLFSLEMSGLEVTQRILCAEARVDSTKVRNGRLSEADWTKLNNAVGRLDQAPLFIDDNPNVGIMEIRAKARRLKSKTGDLGAVIVDYVQLMSGRSSAESRQVEVSEISRNLKILARELNAPVVALAQLNRQLEQRADKRPMLADLRESGSLEQDADVVLFLYRDEVYNAETPDRGTAEILVAKHRSGPTGKVRLAWLDHYTKFANMAQFGGDAGM